MKRFSICLILCLFSGIIAFANGASDRSLDDAITQAANEIAKALSSDKQIAVLNYVAPNQRLSDYILEELYGIYANTRTIVERSRRDVIEAERKFQGSLKVSDNEIRSIGNELGADYVITGQLESISKKTLRFRAYAIDIVRGTRVAQSSFNIPRNDERIVYYLGSPEPGIPRIAVGAQSGAMWGLGTTSTAQPPRSNSGGSDYNIKVDRENFGFLASGYFAFAFTSNFKLQLGANLATNNGLRVSGESRSSREYFEYSYTSVDFSLLPYLSFNPSSKVLLKISAGPYLSLAVTDLEFNIPDTGNKQDIDIDKSILYFGALGDIGLGFRVGPKGIITLDARYLYDIEPVKTSYGELLHRQGINLLFGYEYWF